MPAPYNHVNRPGNKQSLVTASPVFVTLIFNSFTALSLALYVPIAGSMSACCDRCLHVASLVKVHFYISADAGQPSLIRWGLPINDVDSSSVERGGIADVVSKDGRWLSCVLTNIHTRGGFSASLSSASYVITSRPSVPLTSSRYLYLLAHERILALYTNHCLCRQEGKSEA